MDSERSCSVCECAEESCSECKAPQECTNCVSCCCPQEHSAWRQERIHKGLIVEYLSLGWMSVEVVGSIVAAVLASSFALLAFGSDSLIEMLSAIVVLRHLNVDYSGSSALGEKTAKLTTYLLISLVPVIGVSSTYSFFVLGTRSEASILGLAIAVGAVFFMPYLWREKREIGLETACLPLSIDAIESETCFLMSLALLAGLVLEFVLKSGLFDYLATLAILFFVAKEGREAWKKS